MTEVFNTVQTAAYLDIREQDLRTKLKANGICTDLMYPRKEYIEAGYFKRTRAKVKRENYYELRVTESGLGWLRNTHGMHLKSEKTMQPTVKARRVEGWFFG